VDQTFIEGLLDLFERSALAELEYSEGDSRIRLVKHPSGSLPGARPPARPMRTSSPQAPRTATQHVIRAGLAGLFFRRPAPAQPPFVAVGDVVEEGQKLGILEAMKTLNPIEADRAGRIAEIKPEDGALVEPGAPLFVLVPADGTGV